jgi:hypothetical protein
MRCIVRQNSGLSSAMALKVKHKGRREVELILITGSPFWSPGTGSDPP